MRKVITHSGPFHADDVFAVAALSLLHPEAEIIRTRHAAILGAALDDPTTVLVDVGGVYATDRLAFDHHQRNFSARRPNGAPYAAFGLVWETWGSAVVEHVIACLPRLPTIAAADIFAIATEVDEGLVEGIDASDFGAKGGDGRGHAISISTAIALMRPPAVADWGVGISSVEDDAFDAALDFARTVILGAVGEDLGRLLVRRVFDDEPGPIVTLDRWLPWIGSERGHHLFVVAPGVGDGAAEWVAQCVGRPPRCAFPATWGGLSGEELERASGVIGARFCHRAGFVAGASSQGGAEWLAQRAIEEGS